MTYHNRQYWQCVVVCSGQRCYIVRCVFEDAVDMLHMNQTAAATAMQADVANKCDL